MIELAKRRRSTRVFQDKPIDTETLSKLLHIGQLAPSSWGKTPVEFMLVDNRQLLDNLAMSRTHTGTALKHAPYGIAVLVNKELGDFWIEDGAVAATFLLLAAEHLNLGACWIQIHGMEGGTKTAEENVRTILDIPSHYGVLCILALGYKGEEKAPHRDKVLNADLLHKNTF
ncbi:nitroreductase family protein [Eubacteriales bacterium OttesenSCG-928-M02]|nr:nitroreductase family protein [Eubacteriales bacterium OttesenSCG-928-M02]